MLRLYMLAPDKQRPVLVHDPMEWSLPNDEERVVQQDSIGETLVSTVFLGIDHSYSPSGDPVLWETMIFGGRHDDYRERYTSHAASLEGHKRALRLVRGSQRRWDRMRSWIRRLLG